MPVISRFALVLVLCAASASAQKVDPLLRSLADARPFDQHAVAITFKSEPTAGQLTSLALLGITNGYLLRELPIVLTAANRSQIDALARRSEIRSLYANRVMKPLTNVSRGFIGVTALRSDAEVTRKNGGLPVSGNGVGVAVIDTGIDATHPDLLLGQNVVQNVLMPLVELSVIPTACPAIVGLPGLSLEPLGLLPPVYLENQPLSDVEGGHGTFVAGVIGGTGQQSGDFYGGVAPGANLIGINAGNDCGLPLFGILQAFDYVLVNQFRYGIRVANNSWGAPLSAVPYDPDDPINVATRTLHDRNITVVFSAGNSGDTPGAINPYSVAPWVISVAASEKQGLGVPASFSSRGEDDGTGTDVAGQPADPNAPPNLRPDLTAPGVDIKSTRSKGLGLTNTLALVPLFGNDLTTIAPANLPFYTTSQGTSFSAPHVTGVVALMMEANPLLTPDEVVTILRQTTTPMPYEERVVGAGYLDAHNAVRAAMGLAAVPHPADLFPDPSSPEIADLAGDQLGTNAQDIVGGDFQWDSSADQLEYRLSINDLSLVTPNMRWTMGSNWGTTNIFVSADVDELGQWVFEYGRVVPDPATGISNQESLGTPDSGRLEGNDIVVRLSREKLSAAAGFDVLETTSTASAANAWLLIGTSLTGGLLLNSDAAAGRDFQAGDSSSGGEGGGDPAPAPAAFCEQFPGVLASSATAEIALAIKLPTLDAKANYHPGSGDVRLELLDSSGALVAASQDAKGKRLTAQGLEAGAYTLRFLNMAPQSIDYTINSCQAPAE